MNHSLSFTACALCLSATFIAPSSQAETIWADGVSASGGWYDANKTHADDPDWSYNYPNDSTGLGTKTDDNMCYAAAAANLISWWQDLYERPAGIPHGVDSTTGQYSLTGTDAWSTFVQNSLEDTSGNVPAAIKWWMIGDDESNNVHLNPHNGYYSDYIPQGTTLYAPTASVSTDFIQKHAGTAENIIEILQSGRAAALELGGHSITLWGAELDDSGVISHLFLTDSDDYTGTADLMKVELSSANDKVSFTLGADVFDVQSIFTINPTVSDGWGLTRAATTGDDSVPEPATATLSLLALAALAARRRR